MCDYPAHFLGINSGEASGLVCCLDVLILIQYDDYWRSEGVVSQVSD